MLTPSFDIEQNDQFVVLTIRVPYVKISEAEFYINGTEFKFYCKPYFLRLHLPGELADDDRQKASYDVDKGTIVAQLPKLNRGQHFENLGMITSLLSKKPTKDLRRIGARPKIDDVTPDSCAGGEVVTNDSTGESGEESDDFDWELEQNLSDSDNLEKEGNVDLPFSRNYYGFANQHSGVFSKLQEEIPSIVDCPDPDHMTSRERRLGRIAHEETSFDPEHYLADLMDNDAIEGLLKYEPPWRHQLVKWREKRQSLLLSVASAAAVPSSAALEPEPGQDIVSFSPEERDQLKELSNRDFLLDKAAKRSLYLGLVDIIFAFAYNHRTTLGDNNVESAWNVCKLSSTLSWLEVFRGSVHEVIYCCLRRALAYPLFRHWQLALAVLQDTRDIFRLGRRKVLQCLLAVRQLLNSSEPYYILNNLYITEYCVWIQKASARKIQTLADELDEVKVDKSTVGWELLELEEAAQLVLEEQEEESHRDKGDEETGENTSDQADTTLKQLTSNFEKIQISAPQELTCTHTTDRIVNTSDLTTEVDNEINIPTLTNGHTTQPQTQTQIQTDEEEAELTRIRLCCSSSPPPKTRGKPLIEEIDQNLLETAATTSSGSSGDSDDSSSNSGEHCSTCGSCSESDCSTKSQDLEEDNINSCLKSSRGKEF